MAAKDSVYKTFIEKKMTLFELERDYILAVLEHLNGNKTQSAKFLKISIRTIRNKIDMYTYQDPNLYIPKMKGWMNK